METEMVIFESFGLQGCESCAEPSEEGLRADLCMAVGMQKPPISSPASLLEYLLDMAFARFMPRHVEVEMEEAFLATVDAKELEMMMVMWKPVNSRLEERHCEGNSVDMETEMVSQMYLET